MTAWRVREAEYDIDMPGTITSSISWKSKIAALQQDGVRPARPCRDLAHQDGNARPVLLPCDRRAGESTRADRHLSCLMTGVEFPATKERPSCV